MIRSGTTQASGACRAALFAVLLIFGGCSDQGGNPEQLLATAKQERDKGNYRNAIIHLKAVLQKSPQNAEARYLLGVTFNDVSDFRSGEIELRKAIELRYDLAKVKIGKSLVMMGEFQRVLDQVNVDPNVSNELQAEVLTLRALASFGLNQIPEGNKLLQQALAKQPEFAEALLAQAGFAAGENRLKEASQLLERALASDPKNSAAWRMKGELARMEGDQAGAATAYQKVLELRPENILARLNIASLHIAAGKFDDARNQIEQARKIAPNLPETRFLLGVIEFHKKNYNAARDAALETLKTTSDYLPGLLLAGAVEYTLGNQTQAQAHLARALQQAPGNLSARKLLVASLAKSGEITRAIEVLQPGLQQAPENGELLRLTGELYLQSNEFPKAAQYFEKAAKLDPKSAKARTKLGVSHLALGQTDRALADMESAVRLDSDEFQADVALIMLYLQRRNHAQALEAATGLEKKQPNNPLTYNLKAAIYFDMKDVAAARKQLERALELQPTYTAAAINLARLDLDDKNPQAARRRFEAILAQDKDNVQALLALAELSPRLGATRTEQIDWLERASKASPALVQPQLMLARLYVGSGYPKKAREIVQPVAAANPENPEVLETLGAIQTALGEKGQALATYGKLAALQPKSPDALYSLARAQAANGSNAAAASTLEKALALRPGFSEAQSALVELEIVAGHLPEAMKIARQVQKQSAKSALGFVLEGDVLMAEKRFPQAVKVYETAYKMESNRALVAKLHVAYTQAGKPQEGEARLAQWLKESPNDSAVRLLAADASRKNGNYKSAIEHYEWLLKKQPDDVGLLNNLAWTYQQVKDARALETAERAYKLKSDDAGVADTFGWMLVEQGNAKRGVEVLQKAVATAPKDTELRYHLAQALLKAGDRVKARQELEKLLSDAPGSPFEKEARQLLSDLGR